MAESLDPKLGHDGHDGHDPELIVALLDRDLPDADRASAQVRVAGCSACAALHDDLVAIATANLALPTPPRPRDFSLTPALAAALAPHGAREPVPAGTRLTADMTGSRSHAVHDHLLVANLIGRSVSDSERLRGKEQLAACLDCARLYEDLVALSAATRALLVPSRPRSFVLTTADAERLRVRGWRRLLGLIGSTRDVFSRPLAIGLTTLGLAGLLVATIPSALPGVASSPETLATAEDVARNAAGAAVAAPETSLSEPSAAPAGQAESGSAAASLPEPAPGASPAADLAPMTSAEAAAVGPENPNTSIGGAAGEPGDGFLSSKSLAPDERTASMTMIVVAGLLFLIGLGLFGLRWVARRAGDG